MKALLITTFFLSSIASTAAENVIVDGINVNSDSCLQAAEKVRRKYPNFNIDRVKNYLKNRVLDNNEFDSLEQFVMLRDSVFEWCDKNYGHTKFYSVKKECVGEQIRIGGIKKGNYHPIEGVSIYCIGNSLLMIKKFNRNLSDTKEIVKYINSKYGKTSKKWFYNREESSLDMNSYDPITKQANRFFYWLSDKYEERFFRNTYIVLKRKGTNKNWKHRLRHEFNESNIYYMEPEVFYINKTMYSVISKRLMSLKPKEGQKSNEKVISDKDIVNQF